MSTDTNTLPRAYGMMPARASQMIRFCSGGYRRKQLLIIVRGSNPTGLHWHGHQDIVSKPVGIKAKTDADGLVRHDGKRYYPDYDIPGVYELRDSAPSTYYRLFAGTFVDRSVPAALYAREPSPSGIRSP